MESERGRTRKGGSPVNAEDQETAPHDAPYHGHPLPSRNTPAGPPSSGAGCSGVPGSAGWQAAVGSPPAAQRRGHVVLTAMPSADPCPTARNLRPFRAHESRRRFGRDPPRCKGLQVHSPRRRRPWPSGFRAGIPQVDASTPCQSRDSESGDVVGCLRGRVVDARPSSGRHAESRKQPRYSSQPTHTRWGPTGVQSSLG